VDDVAGWSPIVELRQYMLHPGRRDVLIDLFDSRFVESQEATGMKVIGQFRDLARPDRFVWLRGFDDMEGRARSLAEFYGGPIWKAHSAAANATMIDSDDVLLLRPARPRSAFSLDGSSRTSDNGRAGAGFVAATILNLQSGAEGAGAVAFLEESIAPAIREGGGSILGYFATEPSENTFPSLPVREGEQVLAWFAGFGDRPAMEIVSRRAGELARSAASAIGLERQPVTLQLEPTSRSLLDGRSPQCRALADEGRAIAST
jgi:NIPSNAP